MIKVLTDLSYTLAEQGDGYYSIHRRLGLRGNGQDLRLANANLTLFPGTIVLIPSWMLEPSTTTTTTTTTGTTTTTTTLDPGTTTTTTTGTTTTTTTQPPPVRYRQGIGLYPNFHTDGTGDTQNTKAKLDGFVAALGGRWYDVLMVSCAGDTAHEMRSAAWGQFVGPASYLPDLTDVTNVEILAPLNPSGGDPFRAKTPEGLEEIRQELLGVAAGSQDANHAVVAKHVLDAGYPNAIFRLGSEADNVNFSNDSSKGPNADAYIAAFRHLVEVYRAVSPTFQFCWTTLSHVWVPKGPMPSHVYPAYPGDDHVDYIGMDIYYSGPVPMTDAMWAHYQGRMQEHVTFAEAHGKQVCYPEWAVTKDDPTYVTRMCAWHRSLGDRLAYANYFASSANHGNGVYDPRVYPGVWDAYVTEYGV